MTLEPKLSVAPIMNQGVTEPGRQAPVTLEPKLSVAPIMNQGDISNIRGAAPERMSIMETMERKKPRPRRSFTPEFKADIVERCRAGDRIDRPGGPGLRPDRDRGAGLGEPGRDRRRRA